MKSCLSKGAHCFKCKLKKMGTFASGMFFGKQSYPIFGVPSGLTTGLGEEGTKQILYPSKFYALMPPKTVENTLYWQMKELIKGFYLQEAGVLVLKEGIATHKGGNLSFTGKLVTTFLHSFDGKAPHQDEHFSFSVKNFFPRMYRAKSPVITLTTGWQSAFYHWMYEVLPRLHLLENTEYVSVPIFVETALPFQKESLALLDISPCALINAATYAAVKTAQLIVPSIPLIPTEWSCNFLRTKFLPKLIKKPPIRLYISRKDASRRRILNEHALFLLLQQYGFQKIELSRLTFKEQAECFYAAEAIVAPHGAGLSHLVFCNPKTPVLEIFSPLYFHPCYWHVCDRIGLNYHYLFGEKGEDIENEHRSQDPDILVDLDKLKASLKLMNLHRIS